jgi:hypothetical protein
MTPELYIELLGHDTSPSSDMTKCSEAFSDIILIDTLCEKLRSWFDWAHHERMYDITNQALDVRPERCRRAPKEFAHSLIEVKDLVGNPLFGFASACHEKECNR